MTGITFIGKKSQIPEKPLHFYRCVELQHGLLSHDIGKNIPVTFNNNISFIFNNNTPFI